MNRDPRQDPRPGDKLRVEIEVMSLTTTPNGTPTVGYRISGSQFHLDLPLWAWQALATQDVEVVKVSPERDPRR